MAKIMNPSVSDEELQLKKRARRRLVGAIVLVLLAVIFLPLVLEKEPKPVGQDINIQIPPQDANGNFNSKIVPVPDNPVTAVSPVQPVQKPAVVIPKTVETALAPKQDEKVEKVKESEPVEPKSVAAAPEKPKKTQPAPKPKTAKTGFVVQLATFSDPENAKQLQAKLTAAGFKSYTEILKTAKGHTTRVRVGPFATRQAAEETRDKLKAKDFQGIVTSAK
jgi:DedD protein